MKGVSFPDDLVRGRTNTEGFFPIPEVEQTSGSRRVGGSGEWDGLAVLRSNDGGDGDEEEETAGGRGREHHAANKPAERLVAGLRGLLSLRGAFTMVELISD